MMALYKFTYGFNIIMIVPLYLSCVIQGACILKALAYRNVLTLKTPLKPLHRIVLTSLGFYIHAYRLNAIILACSLCCACMLFYSH